MQHRFVNRDALAASEWDYSQQRWVRPEMEMSFLREISHRSTLNGLLRIVLYFATLAGVAALAWMVMSSSWLIALVLLYLYYFLFGFMVAPGHELQHGTVFGRRNTRLTSATFFLVQLLMWNSPRYAKISHRLHHRYTMIHGMDPETVWPNVITTKWMRRMVIGLLLRVLLVGAVWGVLKSVAVQISRAAGRKDEMMSAHCDEADLRVIRQESAAILLIQLAVMGVAIVTGLWQLILIVTIAWHVGSAFENIWHRTEHIGRPYNVNDHRLNTRSVRVGRVVNLLLWGLDDHVEHHLYPSVPSKNLPLLRDYLASYVGPAPSVVECWDEMFAIAREKSVDPATEVIPHSFE